MLYKSVAPFTQGLDAQFRSHAIDPGAFEQLQQMRVFQGVILNFPGWQSILTNKIIGPFGTMIEEFIDLSGAAHLLVAGPDKVYLYDATTKAITDISGALTFNATRDDPWWPFFFNDSMYFTQKNDGLHKWNGGTVTPVAGAPKGKVGGVLAAHLCLFNVNDGVDHPQRFQWAAEATDNVWITAPNNDAGSFDISESGDIGIGALPIQDDLVLYKEDSIIQITFIGGNEVFGRRYTVRGVGLLGPYAVVDIGGEHIFMSNDSFYRYSGGNVTDDIGLKINKSVYPMLNLARKHRIRAVYIHETREVLFIYCSVKSDKPDADMCTIYNTQERIWYGPFRITCSMIGSATRDLAIVVNDVLDIVDTVDIIVNNYPSGDASHPRTLFIDDLSDLHEIGMVQDANGVPITRTVETGDHFLGINATDQEGAPSALLSEAVFQLCEVNLEFTYIDPGEPIQMWIGHRFNLQQPVKWVGPYFIKASTTSEKIKQPVRTTGRWFRFRLVIPNSRQITLAGYQYGFNFVGRR
jgi:hypothetical protein